MALMEIEPPSAFYDALLLACEHDADLTIEVKTCLEKFVILRNGFHPKLCLASYEYFPRYQFTFHLYEAAYAVSTFVFVIISENFHLDFEAQFMKNEFIASSIRSPDRRWRVIPLFTKPRGQIVNLPFGLQGLRGIDISPLLSPDAKGLNGGTSQERRSVQECAALLNGRLQERLDKEQTLRYQLELVTTVTATSSEKWRKTLIKCRLTLVNDLQLEGCQIVDALVSAEVLNVEQSYQVNAEKTPHDKCRKLLGILHVKSEPAIELFVNLLKDEFSHVYNILVSEAAAIELKEQEDAKKKKHELESLMSREQLLPQIKVPSASNNQHAPSPTSAGVSRIASAPAAPNISTLAPVCLPGEHYPMSDSPKGYCCIMVLSADETTNRQADTLQRLFEWLGLNVVILFDVNANNRTFTAKEIMHVIEDFSMRDCLATAQCVAVCVVGGHYDVTPVTDRWCIVGHDLSPVYVSDIVHLFTDDNPFRSLRIETPKMFFFVTHQQRCKEDINSSFLDDYHVFICGANCTRTEAGQCTCASKFVLTLSRILMLRATSLHLESLIEQVEREFAPSSTNHSPAKQSGDLQVAHVSSLTKKLYFFPPDIVL